MGNRKAENPSITCDVSGGGVQQALLKMMEGSDLTFTDDAMVAIAKKAIERKTGARGLRSILELILLDTMFDLPSEDGLDSVLIDKDVVAGSKDPVRVYGPKEAELTEDAAYLRRGQPIGCPLVGSGGHCCLP